MSVRVEHRKQDVQGEKKRIKEQRPVSEEWSCATRWKAGEQASEEETVKED